ncbi:Alpha/beta hydrolase family [Mycobacteroides abscessus subsp. abscessus]|nr:Alpha/beta hydrolase family [Mycobacteroides abscessus subsp. abscessus]SHX37693.1 Alpha/beta hydrolase family [Mycobacteroides abscessus subsp. abscessus]SIA58016.1 Alpha/beta hydrolase family [Mycobacteroides abscessus subsp. abscessus]SIA65340.1 Alpha/beta hydrolase family [Mycobacteroides abscessus subsp. abscessus]SIB58049.1 Alpha/beta hydrolase family [Mycobacteroides abscessus subsp. abscessus]
MGFWCNPSCNTLCLQEIRKEKRSVNRAAKRLTLGSNLALAISASVLAGGIWSYQKDRSGLIRRAKALQQLGEQLDIKAAELIATHPRDENAQSTRLPGILFENGLCMPPESWHWVIQGLRADFRTVCYTRPGYGLTPARASQIDMAHLAIDRFPHDQKIVYVAHSIGALFLERYLHAIPALSERVELVVLVDPTVAEDFVEVPHNVQLLNGLRQSMLLEQLGSLIGTSRIDPDIQRDINCIRDVQERYIDFVHNYKNLRTARREINMFLDDLPVPYTYHCPVIILMSDENTRAVPDGLQQHQISSRADICDIHRISGSNHHSIIGTNSYASQVVETIKERF